MKITGASVNKVINMYGRNKSEVSKSKEITKKDYIEISQLGKNLSTFSSDEPTGISSEKLERIRSEISKGTYKVDARLVAEKMVDAMKGRIG